MYDVSGVIIYFLKNVNKGVETYKYDFFKLCTALVDFCIKE